MPGTHGNVTGEVKSQQKVNRYKMGWKGVIFKASVSFREWRQYKGNHYRVLLREDSSPTSLEDLTCNSQFIIWSNLS